LQSSAILSNSQKTFPGMDSIIDSALDLFLLGKSPYNFVDLNKLPNIFRPHRGHKTMSKRGGMK
jgi:hypothetical protein